LDFWYCGNPRNISVSTGNVPTDVPNDYKFEALSLSRYLSSNDSSVSVVTGNELDDRTQQQRFVNAKIR